MWAWGHVSDEKGTEGGKGEEGEREQGIGKTDESTVKYSKTRCIHLHAGQETRHYISGFEFLPSRISK